MKDSKADETKLFPDSTDPTYPGHKGHLLHSKSAQKPKGMTYREWRGWPQTFDIPEEFVSGSLEYQNAVIAGGTSRRGKKDD